MLYKNTYAYYWIWILTSPSSRKDFYMYVCMPYSTYIFCACYNNIIINLIACASTCSEGARRCSTVGGGCCSYYYDDMCVEHCPLDSHVMDDDFNCVDRM